ncbi:unnamed protein product [Boreogadus saida]
MPAAAEPDRNSVEQSEQLQPPWGQPGGEQQGALRGPTGPVVVVVVVVVVVGAPGERRMKRELDPEEEEPSETAHATRDQDDPKPEGASDRETRVPYEVDSPRDERRRRAGATQDAVSRL